VDLGSLLIDFDIGSLMKVPSLLPAAVSAANALRRPGAPELSTFADGNLCLFGESANCRSEKRPSPR